MVLVLLHARDIGAHRFVDARAQDAPPARGACRTDRPASAFRRARSDRSLRACRDGDCSRYSFSVGVETFHAVVTGRRLNLEDLHEVFVIVERFGARIVQQAGRDAPDRDARPDGWARWHALLRPRPAPFSRRPRGSAFRHNCARHARSPARSSAPFHAAAMAASKSPCRASTMPRPSCGLHIVGRQPRGALVIFARGGEVLFHKQKIRLGERQRADIAERARITSS